MFAGGKQTSGFLKADRLGQNAQHMIKTNEPLRSSCRFEQSNSSVLFPEWGERVMTAPGWHVQDGKCY